MHSLRGKNVLVTGGFGFIGSHLVRRLLQEDALVTVISRRIPVGRDIAELAEKVSVVITDFTEEKIVGQALVGADIVYHLAASAPFQPHYSEEKSIDDLKMMLTLVRESSKAKVKKIIFLSGHVVYGIPSRLPITEKHSTNPVNLYGVSKLSAEMYLKQLCNSYGIGYVIIRAASCYGPGQVSKGAIPNFMQNALQGKVLSASKMKRDYVYVDDLASALLSASAADNKVYNIGGGKSYSVAEVAAAISALAEKGKVEVVDSSDPLQDNVLDISLAKDELAFSPMIGLMEGLKRYMQWMQMRSLPVFYVDLDGTLVNPFPRLHALHKDLCAEFSVQAYSEEEFIGYKKRCIPDQVILGSLLSAEPLERYFKRKKVLLESAEYLQHDVLFPRSVEVLKRLREKGQLVLVTRRKEVENVHAQLRQLGIHDLFDGILVIGNAQGSKAQLIRDNLPWADADSIIIGDTEDDINAGKELGIKTIAVTSGMRDASFLQNLEPDVVVKDISEVLGLL